MTTAVFDIDGHAIAPGWATYQMDTPTHPHIDAEPPVPADGHSPSNYARCGCGAWFGWFVVGQHRYGSIPKGPEPTTDDSKAAGSEGGLLRRFLDGMPKDGLPDTLGNHSRVVTVCGHCGELWSNLFPDPAELVP